MWSIHIFCYLCDTSEDEFRKASSRGIHMSTIHCKANPTSNKIDLTEEVKFLVEAMNKVTDIRYGGDRDSTKSVQFEKMKERMTRIKQEFARIIGTLKIQPGKTDDIMVDKQVVNDINQLMEEMGGVTEMESVQSDKKVKEEISLIHQKMNSVMDVLLRDCKEKHKVEDVCEEQKTEVKVVEEMKKVEECPPVKKRLSPHDVKRVSCYPRIPKKSGVLCRLIKKFGIKSRCNCNK